MTVPNQQADLLPRLLGMDSQAQRRVTVRGARATLYFPNSTHRGSHVALFVEVIRERHPSPGSGTTSVDSMSAIPPASLLAAAVTGAFGLTPVDGLAETGGNSVDGSDLEFPLRISVRHLFLPGTLAHVEDAFRALGWHAKVIEVPFADMPIYYGVTGFVELRLTYSGPPISAMARLCRLLPLLDAAPPNSYPQVRGPLPSRLLANGVHVVGPGMVDPGGPTQIVAGSGGCCGSADSDESLSPPRQGLAAERVGAVLAILAYDDAKTVLDLGCGRGDLLSILAHDSRYAKVLGVDADATVLRMARHRLQLHWLPDYRQVSVRLVRGSLLAPDPLFRGFDAAVLMEVVEHLDPHDLPRLVGVVFGDARPQMVLVTTPNVEHTRRFPSLGLSGLRHPDHRFEWTRSEFTNWVSQVASAYGYLADIRGVGATHLAVGAPTQLAVFRRS